MCALPGGWAVVQRFVHDMASLQYHWMSAHAWLPSGTKRPSGSAMPHKDPSWGHFSADLSTCGCGQARRGGRAWDLRR